MARDLSHNVNTYRDFSEVSEKAVSFCADIAADAIMLASAFVILAILLGSLLGLADSLLLASLLILNLGIFRFRRKRAAPKTA